MPGTVPAGEGRRGRGGPCPCHSARAVLPSGPVRVVGIQPAAITLGTELSPEVVAAVPGLIAAVMGYLAAWQAEDGATAGG